MRKGENFNDESCKRAFVAMKAATTLWIVFVVVILTVAAGSDDDGGVVDWNVVFPESDLTVGMGTEWRQSFNMPSEDGDSNSSYVAISSKPELVTVGEVMVERNATTNQLHGTFNVTTFFIGNSKIYIEREEANGTLATSQRHLNVIIIRRLTQLDHIFTAVVGVFVFFLYVSFGAALDLGVCKKILQRPIGPAIGFFGQFTIMPLASFALGYLCFADNVDLRLGLFFTGICPGGGLSNIFTVALNGNLDLSIAMTAISKIFALGMMPAWIFTLGRQIFAEYDFAIPYKNIIMLSIAPSVPLIVGILLKQRLPEFTKTILRILKPIAMCLIVVMIVLTMWTNSYIYQLFSYRILIAGMCLPWCGYILGWLCAKLFKQNPEDAITIAIETGIQNIGVAIFLIAFSLPQPQADLTSVVPITCGMMTPLPLLLLMLILNISKRKKKTYSEINIQPEGEEMIKSKIIV